MPAYLLVDCEVTDPARYEIYKKLAPPAIAKYGGRYLVRGGAVQQVEGDWRPNRIVVLEFPDTDSGAALLRFARISRRPRRAGRCRQHEHGPGGGRLTRRENRRRGARAAASIRALSA